MIGVAIIRDENMLGVTGVVRRIIVRHSLFIVSQHPYVWLHQLWCAYLNPSIIGLTGSGVTIIVGN